MALVLGGWAVLAAGFLLGWVLRWRLLVASGASRAGLDRTLLVSLSHLLEDAESALSSFEGEGAHRAQPLIFARIKGKVALAQMMARNLLGVEQQFGRGSRPPGVATTLGLDYVDRKGDPF